MSLHDAEKPWYKISPKEWKEWRTRFLEKNIAQVGEELERKLSVKFIDIPLENGNIHTQQISNNVNRVKIFYDVNPNKDFHQSNSKINPKQDQKADLNVRYFPEKDYALVPNFQSPLYGLWDRINLPEYKYEDIIDLSSINMAQMNNFSHESNEENSVINWHVSIYFDKEKKIKGKLSVAPPNIEEGIRTNCLQLKISLPNATQVYGLGEKYWGLNKAGRKYVLFNTDYDGEKPLERKEPMYQSHPFLIFEFGKVKDKEFIKNSRYLALFLNRPELVIVNLEELNDKSKNDGELVDINIELESPIMDLFLIEGNTLYEIIDNYSHLTGRIQQPPLWSLGMHQCRWGYKSSSDIRKITKEYRKREIPCDTIWFDIDYMDSWADFTWHPERFSDYKELLQELHQNSWKAVTIIDPGMALKSNYPQVLEGIEKNYFSFKDSIKDGTLGIYEGPVWPLSALFPDFYRTEVKKWWAKLVKDFVLDAGIDGIWNDMNELVSFKKGDRKTWPHMYHLDDDGFLLDHKQVHNVYAIEEAEATVLGLKKAYPKRRPFMLTRAGSPGIQKYSAIWTGDNFSQFEEIWQSIPMLCNLGLSAQPFVGADIGGFGGTCYPPLLIRWTQLGVFYPFARNHSAHQPQEPWVGEHILPSLPVINKRFYRFRYLILPYLYSLMNFASQTGFPAWRPLVAQFPEDEQVIGLDTEVMLGESLLIAPIYNEPDMLDEDDEDDAKIIENAINNGIPEDIAEFAKDKRKVYLPITTDISSWFDVINNSYIEAGKEIDVEVYLHQLPLYIPNEAIIPTRIPEQTTNPKMPKPLMLNIFCNLEESKQSLLNKNELSELKNNKPPNTRSSRKFVFREHILYLDDGDGLDFFGKQKYCIYEMFVSQLNEYEETSNSTNAKTKEKQYIQFQINPRWEGDKEHLVKEFLLIFNGFDKEPYSITCLIDDEIEQIIDIKNWNCNVPRFDPQAWDKIIKPEDLIIPKNYSAEWNSIEKILVISLKRKEKQKIVLKIKY